MLTDELSDAQGSVLTRPITGAQSPTTDTSVVEPARAGEPALRTGDKDGTSGKRGRRRLFVFGALVTLLGCFQIDQLRALFGYSRLVTNEDQTLLWLAGRDLLHLHLHEPNFYGQNYNTVFEAIPGQLFHLLGASLALASPLAAMLLASSCWLVLAWTAARRGHQLAAAAALALPVCMSVPYLLLFDAPRGVLSGDLLAALAIAAAITIRRPRLRLAVLIAAGGLAIAWDNAAALAVLPALGATAVSSYRRLLENPRRTLLVAGAALLVPTGWLLGVHLWYQGHAFDLTAVNVNTRLQLSVLVTNLTHPSRLFGFYAPELWGHTAVVLALIIIALVAAIAASIVCRKPEPAAAALVFLTVLLVTLAVRDTLDVHRDLYLSGSRFLLPMPIGMWVVLYFTLSAIRDRRGARPGRRRLDPRLPLAATVALAAASTVLAQANFAQQVHRLSRADSGSNPVIVVLNSDALLRQCSTLTEHYRTARAQLLVSYLRDVAYGCAAQSGISTLNPGYDRRGWVIREAASRPVTRLLIQGWPCRAISARAGICRAAGRGVVLLVTPRRPTRASLALAGISVHVAGTGA